MHGMFPTPASKTHAPPMVNVVVGWTDLLKRVAQGKRSDVQHPILQPSELLSDDDSRLHACVFQVPLDLFLEDVFSSLLGLVADDDRCGHDNSQRQPQAHLRMLRGRHVRSRTRRF